VTFIGSIVLEGLESSAQVTVVVLEGSGENWIEVKPRDYDIEGRNGTF
jgi:hypothetical protein